MKHVRKFLLVCGIAALLSAASGCGGATPGSSAPPAPSPEPGAPTESAAVPAVEWPAKAVTIYNSSSAGSPTDVMARETAKSLELMSKQTVNVVNKTGGSGGVMFASVLAEANDGYTIGAVTASQIAALQAGLDKDFPLDGFEFVANVQVEPYALAVQPSSSFQTVEEMIGYAKANPGKLQIGGQGTGSAMHLCMLKLAKDADFTFTWLPYEGGSESVKNLLGGHCQAIMTAPATVRQYVEAEQVSMIAITGELKLPSKPEVPTFQELGFDIPLTQYRGFFVKAGIDPAIKRKISEVIREATLQPDFAAFMTASDMEDGYMDAETFTDYVLKDFEAVGKLSQELLP